MKTKNFMAVFGLVLIFATILIGSCSAQSAQDYLKIRGNIVGNENAEIMLYSQDDSSDEWTEVDTKSISSKYRMRLATDLDYLIVFTSDEGLSKAIHISAGVPGTYMEYVDIDFKGSSEKYACLYQNDKGYYTFQTEIAKEIKASLE